MSHDFVIFVKAHLPEVMNDAKKNQALAFIYSLSHHQRNWSPLKRARQPVTTEIQLQDGSILLSFSHNQL